jgi:hypothetical protein
MTAAELASSGISGMSASLKKLTCRRLLLCTRKRTQVGHRAMSVWCQERTHEPEQAAALQLSFALSWSQALRFEHESCGRAFQEQDERLRSLGCLAVGADSRGEFRHLCELSWQWPH